VLSGILAAWREVPLIVLGLIGTILLTLLARKRWLALCVTLLLGWVFYFFRDPARVPALSAPEFIIAPADGRVTDIDLVEEPHFIQGQARRVTVFMTIFDVHVQHSPYSGAVAFVYYQPGSFAPAFLEETQDNESNLIGLKTPHGRIAIKQIAGILARRIVCWVDIGDEVVTGQRLGLIRFGSRVDLLLPPEATVLVGVGQKVRGGQTIVARWP
jgi:phosphatidylserine decarboxylase